MSPGTEILAGQASPLFPAGPASDYAPQVTVRLKTLDGRWEICGVDRMPGVLPESLVPTSNEWGSDGLRFTLYRKVGDVYPDLSAFTPCDIEIDGQLVWAGEVWETPSAQSNRIEVEGRGAAYELDDGAMEQKWVHARMGDWRNIADHPDAIYTIPGVGSLYHKDWEVDVSERSAKLSIPKDFDVPSVGGIFLDMGIHGARKLILTYQGGGAGAFSLRAIGSNFVGHNWDTFASEMHLLDAPIPTARTTKKVTFSTAWRYVMIVAEKGNAVAANRTAYARIFKSQVFRRSAYESGNASILTPTDLVLDARREARTLSDDTSRIAQSAVKITHFFPDAEITPRAVVESAQMYEDWRAKVDERRRLVFEAKPSASALEVGEWDEAAFEDASQTSGAEIYSDVLVKARAEDGEEIVVRVNDLDLADAPLAAFQATNGDFQDAPTVGLAGWSSDAPLVVEEDTDLSLTPSRQVGLLFQNPGTTLLAGQYSMFPTSYDGALVPGRRYVFEVVLRNNGGPFLGALLLRAGGSEARFPFDRIGQRGSLYHPVTKYPGYQALRLSFIAPATTADLSIVFENDVNRPYETTNADLRLRLYILSALIHDGGFSLASRQGRRKVATLSVDAVMTIAECRELGETFLAAHLHTPLKGQLRADYGTVRRVLGGRTVPPHELLNMTGELIRVAHHVDPDTGAVGREGRISAVEYDHAERSARVSIESNRQSLETLLHDMGVMIE